MKCDVTWHMTCYVTWHMTCDMTWQWHVTILSHHMCMWLTLSFINWLNCGCHVKWNDLTVGMRHEYMTCDMDTCHVKWNDLTVGMRHEYMKCDMDTCQVKWNTLTVGMWHEYMTWVHDMWHVTVTWIHDIAWLNCYCYMDTWHSMTQQLC